MSDQPQAENGKTYVVYGQYYWGKGTTLEAAQKRFEEEGGELDRGYAILTFDEETEFQGVDQMGRYFYKRRDGKDEDPNPPTEEIIPAKAKR
jgi:hypothetical protein